MSSMKGWVETAEDLNGAHFLYPLSDRGRVEIHGLSSMNPWWYVSSRPLRSKGPL